MFKNQPAVPPSATLSTACPCCLASVSESYRTFINNATFINYATFLLLYYKVFSRPKLEMFLFTVN